MSPSSEQLQSASRAGILEFRSSMRGWESWAFVWLFLRAGELRVYQSLDSKVPALTINVEKCEALSGRGFMDIELYDVETDNSHFLRATSRSESFDWMTQLLLTCSNDEKGQALGILGSLSEHLEEKDLSMSSTADDVSIEGWVTKLGLLRRVRGIACMISCVVLETSIFHSSRGSLVLQEGPRSAQLS